MAKASAKASRKQLGKGGIAALVGFAVLCVGVMGYFVLVRPKHAAAAELGTRLAAVQAEIDAHPVGGPAPAAPRILVADLFRMAKAMPDQPDMPGLLLELSRVAQDSGIVFESLAPGTATPRDGFQAVPISVTLRGNFYTLSDFLFRLRTLVNVRKGQLETTGRLFNVDTITFAPTEGTSLTATLGVTAFVYGAGPPAAGAPPPPAATAPATTSTDTTATTTTPAPTTTEPAPASAAPPAGGTS